MKTSVNKHNTVTLMTVKKILSLYVLSNLAIFPTLLSAGELIDESHAASEKEVIDIELINGNITLTGWDRKQLQIKGELSDQAQSYDFSSRNGITRFKEEYENRLNYFGRSCDNWFDCDEADRTELEIFVPKNSTVRFAGINVELSISEITGNTQIEIVNGPIEAFNLSGRVSIETVHGAIETNNLDGRISLSTVNGQIRDRGSKGNRVSYDTMSGSIISDTQAKRVDAESVSGSLELDLMQIEDLEASSVSGKMIISLELIEGGQIELSNVSGYTELLLNPDISAQFDINSAVGGDIDNDLSDHKPVQENRFMNSSELQFSLNGGAGNVDISTVTGDILIGDK